MHSSTELQFRGFLNTSSLWDGNSVLGINQFEFLTEGFTHNKQVEFNPKLRLGQLVEQFVFEVLKRNESLELIAQNIQINKAKITIGEIDCLLKQREQLMHVEIVYKFYLYDETVPNGELSKWIGPNRKDDLMQKLTKLKTKQLPLLYKTETTTVLDQLNLKVSEITQSVLFKAQLFVPINALSKSFDLINNDCITGFYLNIGELTTLSQFAFYVPKKRDWLINPHEQVEWIEHDLFLPLIKSYMNEKRSPLCWLKKPDGNLQKFFVVWWD